MLRRERIEEQLGGFYVLQKRLGRGGMGEVWSARDRRLDCSVAIKVLNEELSHDVEFGARFLREAKTLAKFQHPRIVRVKAAGTLREDERLFMVMELVRGKTLRRLLDEHRAEGSVVDWVSAAYHAFQICDALKAAHEAGIIHRDVKPENVIVDAEGDLTLLDFGIARGREATGPLRGRARREASGLMGTPRYMAPELILHGRCDPRSDLYAVGIVLAMMLTGEFPYPVRIEDGEEGLLGAHVKLHPVLRRERNPACPDPLWEIALRLLEKDPAARHATAVEAREELYAVLRQSVPGAHALSNRLHAEHAEHAVKKAYVERGAPARGRPAASAIEVTAQLSDGYVAVSPCSPEAVAEAQSAWTQAGDVTKPIPAGQAPPPMQAPFPLARPARAPLEVPRGLRRSVAGEGKMERATSTASGATARAPSPPSPPAPRLWLTLGIAVGTVGSWLTFALVMSWKGAPSPTGVGVAGSATASVTATANVTATAMASATATASATASATVTASARATATASPPTSVTSTASAKAAPRAPRNNAAGPDKSRLIFRD